MSGTGETGMAVIWFPARGECGLEEERCAAAGEKRGGGGGQRREKKKREERGLEEERCVATGERRGGGGQRKEEKRREILIGADQNQDLFFFCCDSLVFSNKKFCFWFSLAGVAEETKS